jgi:hypothetical protein
MSTGRRNLSIVPLLTPLSPPPAPPVGSGMQLPAVFFSSPVASSLVGLLITDTEEGRWRGDNTVCIAASCQYQRRACIGNKPSAGISGCWNLSGTYSLRQNPRKIGISLALKSTLMYRHSMLLNSSRFLGTLPLLECLHGVGISSWRWNLFMALESSMVSGPLWLLKGFRQLEEVLESQRVLEFLSAWKYLRYLWAFESLQR